MASEDVKNKAMEPMAWFQHDSNAAQDQKCQRLLYRYGNAGYGAFWRLCEVLANTTSHSLPVETDEDWLILAQQIGMRRMGAFDDEVSIDDCKGFIDCLIEIGMLERDGKGRIESARMQRNALYFGMQRANGAKGGRPRKSKAEPTE